MNKKDAAEFIGVSERTLTNYVSKGRLKVDYVKGKTRDVADFDSGELKRLKAEIESGNIEIVKPEIEQPNSESGNVATSIVRASFPIQTMKSRNQETEQQGNNASFYVLSPEQMTQLLEVTRPSSDVPLHEKPVLTFAEAAQLTGISERTLRAASRVGELPARRIGRSDRLRPADVRAWFDRQFEKAETPSKKS